MADQWNPSEGKNPGAHGSGGQQQGSEGAERPGGAEPQLEGAHAARRAAPVSAQLVERSVESTEQALTLGVQASAQAFQRFSKLMTEAFSLAGARNEGEEWAQNLQVASRAGARFTIAAQEASREWLNLAHQGIEANLEGLRELMNCRSMQEVAAVQTKLVRTNFERAMQAGKAIVERSQRSVEETGRALG